MTSYRMILQYDGSRYDGWQRQGNTENTIQGKVETVLGEMCGHRVEIHGAGRTDAGVHAREQVASLRLSVSHTPEEIRDYCNKYLPGDIAVLSVEAMEDRFHARLNASHKHYAYRLWTAPVPNVFERRYLTTCKEKLNIEAMRKGAELLVGTHDFRAFSSNKRSKKSTMRTIDSIDITQLDGEVRIDFRGNGFLYHMVRIMVGTLVEIGQGTRRFSSIPRAFESGERQDTGIMMPPQGLVLCAVTYDETDAT